MLTVFLISTGWIFWGAIAFVLLYDTVALYTEDDFHGGWAVFLTVGTFVGTLLFTDAFNNVPWAAIVAGVCTYLVAGVLWSFKKWVDYVRAQKEYYTSFLSYQEQQNPPEGFKSKRPLAANNKQRITTWMATWPLTFSWWVLTYPRHFFTWAYRHFSIVFDHLATKIWDAQ